MTELSPAGAEFSFEHGKLRPLPWLTEVRWGRIGDRVR